MSNYSHNRDVYVKIGHARPKTCILTAFIGFGLLGIATAEGEAWFDLDRESKSATCLPVPGILMLRTYAFYYGKKKFLAFLVSLYVVCLPFHLHWVFNANCVILGRGHCHDRHCSSFRTL
jgi:hypothetical protein